MLTKLVKDIKELYRL